MSAATETTYYYSTRPQWVGLVFCLLSGVAGLLLLTDAIPAIELPSSRSFIASCLIALACVGVYRLAPRLNERKPALTVSSRGLWMAAYADMGTIPWQAIREIAAAPAETDDDGVPHPSTSILIYLQQPERWYAMMPPAASRFLQLMQRIYNTNLVFDCWQLEYAAPRHASKMCEQLNAARDQTMHQLNQLRASSDYTANPFRGQPPLQPPSVRLV